MKRKKRIGDLLVEHGLITNDDLMAALNLQKGSKQKLGEVLLKNGYITEDELYTILEEHFDIPYLDLNTIYIDPKVPKLISESLATKHSLLPIMLEGTTLTLAMADPLDMIAQDDVRITTGLSVEPVISSRDDILKTIGKYYDSSEQAEQAIQEFSSQRFIEEDVVEEDFGVSNAPMVRLVNTIITQAVKSKASDIHIEPFEKNVRIRYRVDGELREVMTPAKRTHSAIVTRIKIMGMMNISERRIPQDGRVETVIDGIPIDMRISVLPTVYGEKVVIRILDRSGALVSKDALGFTDHNLERLERIMKVPEGVMLVTGPTGSGKTTTLYSLLKELNGIKQNIITVEDPVEYRLEGINQVQVNNKAGLTFASGLRSILRQDPDIIMIGEIRDMETAQIAVRAAITGHMVLSTIHTNDTVSTITRLEDMGVESYLVSSAVVGILAQRLVRRICPKCKESYQATVEELAALGMGPYEEQILHRGAGCNLCNQSGYQGRTAIHEVLVIDHDIRTMISAKAPIDDIRIKAKENGLKTLNDTAIDLVKMGITTIDEMLRMTFTVD